MRIHPLLVARPPKAKAVEVAAAPEDIPADPVSPGAFRAVLTGSPAERCAALQALLAQGLLAHDAEPGMFVYRVVHEGKRWVGLVCGLDAAEVCALADANPSAILNQVGCQIEPAVIHCRMPEEVGEALVHDTNDRPAYHFVAAGSGTHSVWTVQDHSIYVQLMASATPLAVLRGAAHLAAAHATGVPAMAILTRDLGDESSMPDALAPRCGLFVAPVNPGGTATLGA